MSTLLHVRSATMPHWARHAAWFAFAAGVAFAVPFLGVSVLDLQQDRVIHLCQLTQMGGLCPLDHDRICTYKDSTGG